MHPLAMLVIPCRRSSIAAKRDVPYSDFLDELLILEVQPKTAKHLSMRVAMARFPLRRRSTPLCDVSTRGMVLTRPYPSNNLHRDAINCGRSNLWGRILSKRVPQIPAPERTADALREAHYENCECTL